MIYNSYYRRGPILVIAPAYFVCITVTSDKWLKLTPTGPRSAPRAAGLRPSPGAAPALI